MFLDILIFFDNLLTDFRSCFSDVIVLVKEESFFNVLADGFGHYLLTGHLNVLTNVLNYILLEWSG